MRTLLIATMLIAAVPAVSRAQNTVVQPFPAPALSEDASASDFLRAARSALLTGKNGEAAEALEMAQTRLLHRSVPLGQTGVPSDNPAVAQIGQAREALGAHDRETALRAIGAALQSIGTGAM
jgi:hypothetical protein